MRLVPRTTRGRAILAVVALLAGLNAIAIGADALIPSPEGPRSSSFATAPEGLAAWAELERRSDVQVRALRARPASDTLPVEGTVVMLDPDDFTDGQAQALRGFAERGGRVVAGGLEPGSWADVLVPGARWEEGGGRSAAATALGDAQTVRTAGEGHWEQAGDAQAVVTADSDPVVLEERVGSGSIYLVADPSPLQNRLLGEADNAALALALGGRGPLAFVESVHGYGNATGLAALPARFKWALALLGLSGLLLIAARWPRLGPAEPREKPLFPPRRAYVDALAATLARSRDRTAVTESVRSAARERLAARAALPPDADPEAWAKAARAAGLTDEEARALQDGTDEIATGRALARLSV
jgi:Domain of unknown function (DUF4350)